MARRFCLLRHFALRRDNLESSPQRGFCLRDDFQIVSGDDLIPWKFRWSNPNRLARRFEIASHQQRRFSVSKTISNRLWRRFEHNEMIEGEQLVKSSFWPNCASIRQASRQCKDAAKHCSARGARAWGV